MFSKHKMIYNARDPEDTDKSSSFHTKWRTMQDHIYIYFVEKLRKGLISASGHLNKLSYLDMLFQLEIVDLFREL